MHRPAAAGTDDECATIVRHTDEHNARVGRGKMRAMPPKTICPISRADFLSKAEPLKFEVGGTTLFAEPREFSTGSFGWYLNGKATVNIDGKNVPVQVGMNLIVIGSKEAPKDGGGGTGSGSEG
jgi:hypothetical protein